VSDTDIAKFATEGNRDLHILFGSQSGNSEGLAEKWQKEAPRYGLNPTVHDMDGFDIKSMSEMTRVMIICSTWGEGEMPDNAEELYDEAKDAGKILSKTNFSVCSLGDTGYDLFCQSGKDWDKTLQDIGGSRIYDRVDCDVDYEMPAEEWMKGVMPKLACVGDDGAFVPDLEEKMVAYASGMEIDEPEEEEAIGGIPQAGVMMMPQAMTPLEKPRPHHYTGYKQNSYCVKCGKYCFHWHGSSPNNPDLYPNYECKDCGYIRKIKIA
tara:strand:- start:218 stop:1015 length:798 start_codon:yes stop_codon:yes gene_type:complete